MSSYRLHPTTNTPWRAQLQKRLEKDAKLPILALLYAKWSDAKFSGILETR